MRMRILAKLTVILFLLCAAALSLPCATAQEPTATPVPDQGGLVATVFHTSSDVAAWLSGRAMEYAGSPLLTTLAGVMVIVLIVSLLIWLRRPRKPLDNDSPM